MFKTFLIELIPNIQFRSVENPDLQIRGPGEFFGTRQHGLPVLKIANLYEDTAILREAQKAAGYILEYEYNMNEEEKNCLESLILGLNM